MSKIRRFMGAQHQMPNQLNVVPWEHPYHKCEQCGSLNFEAGFLIKQVRGVEIGKVIPLFMEIIRCSKCMAPTFLMTPQGPIDYKEVVKKELEHAHNEQQNKS